MVVLPAPFGPIKPVIDPAATLNEQQSNARNEPKSIVMSSHLNMFYVVSLGSIGNLFISNGAWGYNLRGHFKFLCRTDAACIYVQAIVVICPEPLCVAVLGLLDAFSDVLTKPPVTDCRAVTLNVDVLRCSSKLEYWIVIHCFLPHIYSLPLNVFWAFVHPNGAGQAVFVDNLVY